MPLIDRTEGYLEEVREFADSINMREQLEGQLEYLAGYANGPGCKGPTRCILYRDWAPKSFRFAMERKRRETDPLPSERNNQRTGDPEWVYWFNGGLIFHGAHDRGGDGGAPTYSVCLSPVDGWSVHT